MSAAKPSGSFKFKKNATIGAAAAEDDIDFLEECFVDTGDLVTIENPDNSKRIVIGRTGSGKSALIKRLSEKHENVITISPFELALEHITNSQILNFFNKSGVNLDPFYKLLWRHIFMVELIRRIHHITDEQSQKSYFLKRMIWTRTKKKQYDYVLKDDQSFWKATEHNLKETTHKVEKELKATLKDIPIVDLGGSLKCSDETVTVHGLGTSDGHSVRPKWAATAAIR